MHDTWFDLSQPFYEGMPHGHVVPPPRIRTLKTVGIDDFNIMEYTFATHVGTHVDAPRHFAPGAKTIDEIPLARLAGEAVVLSVKRGPCEAVTVADLRATGLEVRRGDIVLIHTGWGAKYGTPGYRDHPYLAGEVASFLVEMQTPFVGVDVTTPDLPFHLRTEGFGYPIHRTLLRREVLIVENLYLEEVTGRRVMVQAFPIRIRGADAAPARVVARAIA